MREGWRIGSGYAWLGLTNLFARGSGRIGADPIHLMVPLSAGRTLFDDAITDTRRIGRGNHDISETVLLTSLPL